MDKRRIKRLEQKVTKIKAEAKVWHRTGDFKPLNDGFYLCYYYDLVSAIVLERYNEKWYFVGGGPTEAENNVFWQPLPDLPKEV